MTSSNDLRHRLQRYPRSAVSKALDEMVYDPDTQRAMRDMFLGGLTYETAAESIHMSPEGLKKRVRIVAPNVERYLRDN